MKLIKNARRCWRYFSVQALTILAALPLVWINLPPDVKAKVPDAWETWVFVIVALGGLAGRLIDQGGDE